MAQLALNKPAKTDCINTPNFANLIAWNLINSLLPSGLYYILFFPTAPAFTNS
jgi:hypothetical protein